MATFIRQGCKGCRHCEHGAKDLFLKIITTCFICFTCGLGLLIFPFIRKCPICGHSYFLNRHHPNQQQQGASQTNVYVSTNTKE